MFYYPVGDAEDFYFRCIIIDCHKLKHCAAKSTYDGAVLHSNDLAEPLCDLMQHRLVKWFYEAHIIMSGIKVFGGKYFAGGHSKVPRVADRQYCHFLSIGNFSAGTGFDFFKRCAPLRHYALAARIAYHEWSVDFRQLRGVHKIAQFRFIHGCAYDHVWYAAHVGNIVSAVVRWAVVSDKAGPVKTENNRELLYGDIMYHHVISALHKRAVDVAEYFYALRGKPRTECYCVLLGNAYVDGTVGHDVHHEFH